MVIPRAASSQLVNKTDQTRSQDPRRIQRHTRRFRTGERSVGTCSTHFEPRKQQDSFQTSTNIGKCFQEAQRPTAKEKLKGIVYKVTCRKSRGAEHKPGTNGNVISAIKQHAETGHDIHPSYANILETGVSGKNKRLFLESLPYFLDKNSVNERAPFLRVYASLVTSLEATNNNVPAY